MRFNIRPHLVLAALLIATAACGDARLPTGVTPPPLQPLVEGINPVLTARDAGPGSLSVGLSLLSVNVPQRLGGVQGVLEYDPQRLRLTSAAVAGSLLGSWREERPGSIRFSIAAEDGLDDAPMLSLVFAGGAPLHAGWFTLRLEKAVAVDDFSDLGARVVGGGSLTLR